ncbi:GDSL-type esterase/lipase family protein [Chitinophaga barathri]|uniref:GDSL family lipase n=1 Tax=Chitinophaga barathri TaxID=1647451 RepID=A0A3N4MMQ7_9BACT|nr:GDSL-type esterase/lipase family protein [Chitinophaga barathri]RPD40889.1 GDSL family lipase [Chitinophaga barathri]
MKRQVIIAALALLAASSAYAQQMDSSYDNTHYKERMALFATLPAQKKTIVFLGNSITEAGKWNDILPGMPVQNRGISGDVTFGVLARLPQIIAGKPAKVFLLIGVNDLKRGTPVDVIVRNYERITDMLKAGSPKTKIYLQSVLPVNDSILVEGFKKVTNANVALVNEGLQRIAREKGCTYVNLHEVFADARGQLKIEETPDGLHLRVGSYPAWVNYLRSKKYL